MNEPKLTLALAERAGQPVLLFSRNDSKLLNRIDISLARLAGIGYMGACEQVGNTVLRMLQPAHAERFASFPALSPPDEPLVTPHDLIHHLLELSISDRTRSYLGAIEALFTRHAGELAHTSLPEQWPMLRENLLRFPD